MANKFEKWLKSDQAKFLPANCDTPEEIGEHFYQRGICLHKCPARKHCEKSDDREVRCVNAFICLSKEV